MSQHYQLAAGSGLVPADGQVGKILNGPARFSPVPGRHPRRVATVGVEPGSFLRRAILWKAFGPAEVDALDASGFLKNPPAAEAVVVEHLARPVSWSRLLEWAGDRRLIVDVQAAALMAAEDGIPLRVEVALGPTTEQREVMCHQANRTVYPGAPTVEIVEPPPVPTGLAVGDRVHLYTPSAHDLGLRSLTEDSARKAFQDRFGVRPWGRHPGTGGTALASAPTPGGGWVTVMDLQTVGRNPEPSGSETPAIQIFLALLGRSPVTFGRFVVPPAHYGEFTEMLAMLTRKHSRFASLETIGRSVDGRAIHLLKIRRRPNLPVVLLSSAIHPYEWAPVYGVLRYLRFLLERLESDGFEAEEFLATHQVWWVPSVCPDGFDTRCQQPSAINLNRNFPGGWEYAAEGRLHWGSYGAPPTIETINPISLRGPAPASQPETRAMMALLERKDGKVVTLADFHENVGPHNFLHQYEREDGFLPDAAYQVELLDGVCQAFAGRFFEQRDQAFLRMEHEPEFRPETVCGWLGYAAVRGVKGCVVEAAGGDATHYRTVRRTEYAAQVVEQVLACELGRLYRNPFGEDRTVTLPLRRRPGLVECRLYDADGKRVETTQETAPEQISRVVPADGCLRLRFDLDGENQLAK